MLSFLMQTAVYEIILDVQEAVGPAFLSPGDGN